MTPTLREILRDPGWEDLDAMDWTGGVSEADDPDGESGRPQRRMRRRTRDARRVAEDDVMRAIAARRGT